MSTIVVLNIVLILLFAIAGTIYFNWDGGADRFENGIAFLISASFAVGFSLIAWGIYAIYYIFVLVTRLVDKA